jgi:hypothetical protein
VRCSGIATVKFGLILWADPEILRHLAASERVERKFANLRTWLTGDIE